MSIEMQDAFAKDMAVMKEDGTYDYVDNPNEDELVSEAKAEEKPTSLDEV